MKKSLSFPQTSFPPARGKGQNVQPPHGQDRTTRIAFYVLMASLALALLYFLTLPFTF